MEWQQQQQRHEQSLQMKLAKESALPPPPPSEGWTLYQDQFSEGPLGRRCWWYYEGPLGKWCSVDGFQLQKYIEEKESGFHVTMELAQETGASSEGRRTRREDTSGERPPKVWVAEAAEKVWVAGRFLEAAEAASGDAVLGEARQLLEAPGAKNAAVALMTVSAAARSCEREALGAIEAAERAVRDVVVLRCRSRAQTGDRSAFLEATEEAFGRPLDCELQNALLLAFLPPTTPTSESGGE